MLSFVEENYLKAIYHLSEGGKRSVNTNALAEEMKTAPASVSDMIKRLSEKKMVDYQKYRGVNVSEKGKFKALHVIRQHRIWKVFLVEKLNFQWDQLDEVAEQLEHIKSPLLLQRLDEFLGFPKFDPHGDPIPDENGQLIEKRKDPITQLPVGTSGIVVGVNGSSASFLKYLDKVGISIGTRLQIVDRMEFDGSVDVTIDGKKTITISMAVAENILLSEA
ncbi:metal-dependent transcriptional regulator [Roseivirga sp.]|uniref:metal-dependent transcriptional regulator n=1 Tax=Roseivirga sp. TaxID=1964215 RepID=UPI002B2710CF|nr:metal-dependent transcriptional regulator [Roseivirga sp.]